MVGSVLITCMLCFEKLRGVIMGVVELLIVLIRAALHLAVVSGCVESYELGE